MLQKPNNQGQDGDVLITDSAENLANQRLKEFHAILGPPLQKGDLGSLDGYRVKKLLGMGGMGCVFLGQDTRLARDVALKVMRPGEVTKHAALDRFLLEGRAAASIKNDHVVTIHQVGDARGVLYMAMELLRGIPLDKWMEKQAGNGGVQPLWACRIARDTLKGLAAAHEVGLVHRDIKPSNLWLEEGSGRIKILDFGLTRASHHDGTLTQEGMLVGTPAFMSPEQAHGKLVTQRSDLFSLGTVLYQALGGENPFLRESVAATLGAIVNKTPMRLMGRRPDVPAELSNFIDRLLAKNPNNRPASAALALRELQEVERLVRITTATGPGVRSSRPQSATEKGNTHQKMPEMQSPAQADPGFKPIDCHGNEQDNPTTSKNVWTTGRKVALAAGCGAFLSIGIFLLGRGNGRAGSESASNKQGQTSQRPETITAQKDNPAPTPETQPIPKANAEEPSFKYAQPGKRWHVMLLDRFRHENPGIQLNSTWNDQGDVGTVHISGASVKKLEALAALSSLREINAEPASGREGALNLSPLKNLALTRIRFPGRRVSGIEHLVNSPLVELVADLGPLEEKAAWSSFKSLEILNGKTRQAPASANSAPQGTEDAAIHSPKLEGQLIAKASVSNPNLEKKSTPPNLSMEVPKTESKGSEASTKAQQSKQAKSSGQQLKKKPVAPPRGALWANERLIELSDNQKMGKEVQDAPLPKSVLLGLRFGSTRQSPPAGPEIAKNKGGGRYLLWPEELDGPAYRQLRDGLERSHRLGWQSVSLGKSPRSQVESGRKLVENAHAHLARDASLLTPDEYCRAKRFLTGVEQEFKAMMGDKPSVVLSGQWVPDSDSVKTVGQLAGFLANRSISLSDVPEGSKQCLEELIQLLDKMAKSNPSIFRQVATLSPPAAFGD